MRVSWPQVLAWRLGRQLLRDHSATLVDATRQLGGVQAQVASCAELAVGVRTGATGGQVQDALWKDRAIVKTWAMRGTLHLLPADEFPTWVAALKTREQKAMLRRTAAWERYHGISVRQLDLITETIQQVLEAEPLTREELSEAIIERTRDQSLRQALSTGWGATLKPAAAAGALCFGPDRGRNVTFVNPQAWLGGKWKEPGAEEPMRCVIAHFFDAYSPADAADFAQWWGVPPADGRRLLASFAKNLVQVDLDGAKTWITVQGAQDLAATDPVSGHVRLVPAFDTYVFSPKSHRQHTWPDGLHGRISRSAGWITPCLLVDGRVAGVWGYTRGPRITSVEIEAFAKLPSMLRYEAELQAHKLESLLGSPVEVEWVERLNNGSGDRPRVPE